MKRVLRKLRAGRAVSKAKAEAPLEHSASTMELGEFTRLVKMPDNAANVLRIFTDGRVHVSAILNGLCPRMALLSKTRDKTINRFAGANDRIVWEMGRAAEKHVRTNFIKSYGKSNVLGKWVCNCKQTKHSGFWTRSIKCNSCKSRLNNYEEIDLEDDELNVTAHPDLPFVLANGRLKVVEIKSMKKEDFEKLKEPLPIHIKQAISYQILLTRSGFQVDDRPIIFYVCKQYIMGSPYKEFNPLITIDDIENVKNELKVGLYIKKAEDAGSLPARLPVCTKFTTPTAKKCPCVVDCFGAG